MRVWMDHQHCVYVQHCYPWKAQHSRLTVALVQQLWNEWEIQCLVLISVSLQVFLLFFAGFRKRYRSRVLSVLLWLAYLSADTIAVFVLGRLTCVVGDDPRHQMVLFWAPFMLLHLGGQDTITAFSMEDCALWKRHLLNLITQVALAIYVVGKQWRGDRQLVAPMVLMFISGTAKYLERIWILGRASSWAPGSRSWDWRFWTMQRYPTSGIKFTIMEMEINQFFKAMESFMNMLPRGPDVIQHVREWMASEGGAATLAYKLAEMELSLIYDYLYTKFGSFILVFHRLTILVLNSTALALFVVHHKGKGRSAAVKYYSVADVAISYILLVGAVALEISSIFMWLVSSYWPYMDCLVGPRYQRTYLRVQRSILKLLRPVLESGMEWSGKLQQYCLIDEIIQKEKARGEYGWVKWLMWRMGIKQHDDTTTKHVVVSPEVKEVFFDKLREIATGPDSKMRLAFTSLFRAEEYWATHKLQPSLSSSSSGISAAQRAINYILQDNMDIVSRALIWHLVTDICFVSDDTSSKFRTCSQHLSNYIMHLVSQCNLMLDAKGYKLIKDGISEVKQVYIGGDDKMNYIRRVHRGELIHTGSQLRLAARVASVSSKLLRSDLAAADRWEMIATVWVEMLCYIALNCDHEFHAKQLSAGGEFLTHAKMLVFLLVYT